jgi:hypothetical protein
MHAGFVRWHRIGSDCRRPGRYRCPSTSRSVCRRPRSLSLGLSLALSRTAHPGQVRTLVAHEPPVIELLPDSAQLRAQIQDIYDTYWADGGDTSMAKFMAHVGLDEAPHADAPGWEPSPE